MAWTAPATATVGQILTAAFLNAQLRDNMLLTAPSLVTTDGDIVVATAANALKRLAAMGSGDTFLHEIGGLEDDVSAYDGFPLIDGGATANWKMSFTETDAPDANDDITDGWKVGSWWVDVTNDKAYICLDITDGAAVWTEVTAAAAVLTVGQTDVSTEETTTSSTYGDLTTTQAVTLSPGATKDHIVTISAYMKTSSTFARRAVISVALSGDSAVDADAAEGLSTDQPPVTLSKTSLKAAAADATAHTMKFKIESTAATGTFSDRRITAHTL